MFWDGVFAFGDGLEKGTLSATVLTQKTVPTAESQLQVGFVEEDSAVEGQTGTDDLDVSAAGDGSKHTGSDTVG
ncbi:hypothetical protein O1611_g6474 [Lasiodiplodia mahajangana]|uniref:Uncharacterized protein n=1 Tax=Lasiodiplodia mahajangana TaxID=1108764 RepID=A0ACC2JIZ3_9PEZI|nr:hypothetical protein O1611_g6474 [Lasiodiplodia mahajangana]